MCGGRRLHPQRAGQRARAGRPAGRSAARAERARRRRRGGQAYFAANCGSCHSATGDLRGIGAAVPIPMQLQNLWVRAAAAGPRRPRRRGRGTPAEPTAVPVVDAGTVTPTPRQRVEGRLGPHRRLHRLAHRRLTARSVVPPRRRRPEGRDSRSLAAHKKLLPGLHRQGHPQRHGLPGDTEMTIKQLAARGRCCSAPVDPALLGRQAGRAASIRRRSSSRSPSRGRPTRATTPAGASAR